MRHSMNQFNVNFYKMCIVRLSIVSFIIFACFVYGCDGFEPTNVFGTIKSGFEMAGKLLGLDRASGVAQLVSEAFGRRPRQEYQENDTKNTIFSGFLRVLGLDSRRIGAIAVNAIIFIAQVISTSLSQSTPPYLGQGRKLEEGTPLDWMLAVPEVKSTLNYAKDANLPHHIIDYLAEDSNKENTGCLQLLVCKSAPFVWGMQKALNARGNRGNVSKGAQVLTQYLPTLDEYAENGDECETKHPYCMLYY